MRCTCSVSQRPLVFRPPLLLASLNDKKLSSSSHLYQLSIMYVTTTTTTTTTKTNDFSDVSFTKDSVLKEGEIVDHNVSHGVQTNGSSFILLLAIYIKYGSEWNPMVCAVRIYASYYIENDDLYDPYDGNSCQYFTL